MFGVRKQVHELSEADLSMHSLWCYPGVEDSRSDEMTVEAVDPDLFDFHTMFITRATFVLACGRQVTGWVHPDASLGFAQPCMFVGDRSFTFWNGLEPPDETYLASLCSELRLSAASIFPITWRAIHAPPPSPSEGVIPGIGFITATSETQFCQGLP